MICGIAGLLPSDTRRIVINHLAVNEKALSRWHITQIDTWALQIAICQATHVPILIASGYSAVR
jgi:hypothetical protein